MYEKLLVLGKKYVGAVSTVFIDAVLKEANVDKNSITEKDLEAISAAAIVKMQNYGLSKEAYGNLISKDIMGLS